MIDKETYHTFAVYAHIRALRVTSRAVLDFIRQLHHYRLIVVVLKTIRGILRRHRLARWHFLSRPPSNAVLEGLLAAADQSARSGRIIMGVPFEQLSAVWHIVEGGALCRAKIARLLAGLKSWKPRKPLSERLIKRFYVVMFLQVLIALLPSPSLPVHSSELFTQF